MRERLSIILITKNEEAKIARCLASVRFADEVMVVDGESTDRTMEICRAAGARVISHRFSGYFARERALGVEAATGDWMLQMEKYAIEPRREFHPVSRLESNS